MRYYANKWRLKYHYARVVEFFKHRRVRRAFDTSITASNEDNKSPSTTIAKIVYNDSRVSIASLEAL